MCAGELERVAEKLKTNRIPGTMSDPINLQELSTLQHAISELIQSERSLIDELKAFEKRVSELVEMKTNDLKVNLEHQSKITSIAAMAQSENL